MPRLYELQQAFAEAIVEGKFHPVSASLSTDRSALRSVALYRRLIRNNYVQALKVTYPVLHRLVGDCYFGVLGRGYLKKYPSTSGDLFLYGRHLPTLLHRLDAPPFLVELTRLEWACHEVYQAVDSPPLSADRLLQAMALDDPSRVTIQFCPAARLLSFPIPVHRVWLALKHDVSSNESSYENLALPLLDEQTGVIVTRSDGKVQVTPLAWLDYRLVEALSQGADVASVERMALEAEPEFDFLRFMTTLLRLHLIAGFSVERST